MIKFESFDFFGNIPVLEKNGYTFINLLGKNLVCEDFFYPSDESHVAYIDLETKEALVRNHEGIVFPFPPKRDLIFYIVTPDIQRKLHRNDFIVPVISCLISEDSYEASALI